MHCLRKSPRAIPDCRLSFRCKAKRMNGNATAAPARLQSNAAGSLASASSYAVRRLKANACAGIISTAMQYNMAFLFIILLSPTSGVWGPDTLWRVPSTPLLGILQCLRIWVFPMRVQFPSIISYSYMDPSSSDRALSSLSQETTVIFPGDWRLMSTIAPILSASSLLSKLRISSVVMLGKVMVACEDCVVAVSSAAAKVVTASAAIIGSMNLFISSFYSQRQPSPDGAPCAPYGARHC